MTSRKRWIASQHSEGGGFASSIHSKQAKALMNNVMEQLFRTFTAMARVSLLAQQYSYLFCEIESSILSPEFAKSLLRRALISPIFQQMLYQCSELFQTDKHGGLVNWYLCGWGGMYACICRSNRYMFLWLWKLVKNLITTPNKNSNEKKNQ